MGSLIARTTAFDVKVDTRPGETILEALRRNCLPAPGFLLYDDQQQFVSLTRVLGDDEVVTAYSLRNPDFAILNPSTQLVPSTDPVAEIFTAAGEDQTPTLLQFTRDEGIGYIYASAAKVLDDYRTQHAPDAEVQVALSGGGDGRVVGECLGRYLAEHPDARFHAVITANGFEDEHAHLQAATGIADRYKIAYTVFDEDDSAKALGFHHGFHSALERYRNEFPHDEAEILATYWVQELNFAVARAAGRRGIVFGFNQEDVIAERLYQALTGQRLPAYPVRTADDIDIIAPLYKIPKRLIDALDVDNSMRNYDRRQPSVSYLRSSLYFMAYHVVERFPALAAAFADPSIVARASEEVPSWLISPNT
jgi:gamma-glutamylcyclotransferase (GGCT)/AIG2-like uncharacterized protein YtfP